MRTLSTGNGTLGRWNQNDWALRINMALVKHLEQIVFESGAEHRAVDCTYTVVNDSSGRYLQIDTYGSADRKFPGKKSQSLRLTIEAIRELKAIIDANFD
jgi:hypothetical protein